MKRRSSTVLLALLTLTTLVIAAVSVSEVVRTEILISRSVDQVTIAGYAAESALDEGAWRIRYDPTATISNLNGDSGTLANGATWSLNAWEEAPALFVPRLPANGQVGFSTYDPDRPVAGGGKSIQIIRDNTVTPGNYPLFSSQILELTETTLATASGLATPPTTDNVVSTKYGWFSDTVMPTDQKITKNINPTSIYYFTIRNYCTTSTCGDYPPFYVQICNTLDGGSGGSCYMPGRAYFIAWGNYLGTSYSGITGNTRQMILDVPRLDTPSGIFSHAVFSECQIIKDPNAPPSC